MFWKIYSELCKSQNTTPSAVAKAIGLSNAIPTKWKNGALPKGEILLKLSDYFDCSIDYLLKGKEKSCKSELSSLQLELLDRFELLSDIDKGRILDRMQSMYESYTPEQKESV